VAASGPLEGCWCSGLCVARGVHNPEHRRAFTERMGANQAMVTVTLKRPWTDVDGVQHPAGATVQVPEDLLDALVSAGLILTDGTTEWVRCC
jgi:hypothetical protein